MNNLAPKSYEAAKQAATRRTARRLARLEGKPRYGVSKQPRKPLGYSGRKGKPLRVKPDRKLIAWSKAVRERDDNQCQWPGITVPVASDFKIPIRLAIAPCATGDTRIDAHHIAERSLRPDLRLVLSNGIALCRSHHAFLENHRAVGIALKLISTETYEAARKKAA